jgi:putative solute:sodium symporter small subunit
MSMQSTEVQRRYWRTNRIVIASLLVIWFVATFGVSYFARELSFAFFGWPFSFWMGAQGVLGVYIGIVGVYAWYMNRLDASLGAVDEEGEAGQESDKRYPSEST